MTGPAARYAVDTLGETMADTIADAAQGGKVTPGSIMTSLAINAVSDGISARGVKGAKADVPKNKPKAGDVPNVSSSKTDYSQNRKYWTKNVDFNGNKVYQRDDLIDPNLVSSWRQNGQVVTGTNTQRMASGRAPIGPDGKPVNLHHATQKHDGTIAEVTQSFHNKNYSAIHINTGDLPSDINRSDFNKWRGNYWKNRVTDFIE